MILKLLYERDMIIFQRLSGKCIWRTLSAKNSRKAVFRNFANIDLKYLHNYGMKSERANYWVSEKSLPAIFFIILYQSFMT